MNTQEYINYERVAEAISYIKNNFKSQPGLEEVASQVNTSPFHFQRIFTAWAGTSPKKFLQYISVEYAKKILKEGKTSLFEASIEIGLSGSSRLHDLFINIEGMTPGEYRNGGQELSINYSFSTTLFGNIVVASTNRGICYLAFIENETAGFHALENNFPKARFKQYCDNMQQNALRIFTKDWNKLEKIRLHLKGTGFQLKVWETLLKIPMGKLTTYGDIAGNISNPNASRAVGSAIGDNPIAFLIPCHRVIRSTGALGGYMWGTERKTAIIGWEAAKINDLAAV